MIPTNGWLIICSIVFLIGVLVGLYFLDILDDSNKDDE
jgi:hypothetical protein